MTNTIYLSADDERIGIAGDKRSRPKLNLFGKPHEGDILNRQMLGDGRYVILPSSVPYPVRAVIGNPDSEAIEAMRHHADQRDAFSYSSQSVQGNPMPDAPSSSAYYRTTESETPGTRKSKAGSDAGEV